jgi:TonB family protein
MKNSLLLPLLFLFCITGSSQNSKYHLPERQTAVTKKEKLKQAKLITDLTPLLWSTMGLPMNERYFLDHRRVNENPQPVNYVYPQERYKQTLKYVSVEISTTNNGKFISAKSNSDELTAEQKGILNTVDLGADIKVTVLYKYKDQNMDSYGLRNNIVEGVCFVTVVPETEAEFPGGWNQLSSYFVKNVVNQISDKKIADIVLQAVVDFTVTEDGEIVDAKISQTSSYAKIDQMILEAVNDMPKWTPALDSKGVKVKQHIKIPFGVGC